MFGVIAFPEPTMPEELFPVMKQICCSKYTECMISNCTHPSLTEDSLCYIHRKIVDSLDYNFIINYYGDSCLAKGCTSPVHKYVFCYKDLIKTYNGRDGSKKKIFYDIKDYLLYRQFYCYTCDKFSILEECSFCGSDLTYGNEKLYSNQYEFEDYKDGFHFGEEAISYITNDNKHFFKLPGEYIYPGSRFTEEQMDEFRDKIRSKSSKSSINSFNNL